LSKKKCPKKDDVICERSLIAWITRGNKDFNNNTKSNLHKHWTCVVSAPTYVNQCVVSDTYANQCVVSDAYANQCVVSDTYANQCVVSDAYANQVYSIWCLCKAG